MRKDLSTDERNGIIQWIRQNQSNDKPARGIKLDAAKKFKCCPKTAGRLWAVAEEQRNQGQAVYLQSKKKNAEHKKTMYIDLAAIERLSVQKRAIIRKQANGINYSKSTVWRWVKHGLIKAHSSVIKPFLIIENQLERLQFLVESLEFNIGMQSLMFNSMQNTVHIDEKWFYLSKAAHRYYVTPTEMEPHRSCQNKKFIHKVMFMCTVARPIFVEDGAIKFDGKIGIFPFTHKVAAMRGSKNRCKGTQETKLLNP